MTRDDFINSLMQHVPENCTEEEIDVLEQFCFKLYDETNLSESM